MNLLYALPRVAPLLARHALGYVDLATEGLDGIGERLRRRAVAAAVCALATHLAVLLACGLAIALAWDTPYRIAVIVGLVVTFSVVAIVAAAIAGRERRRTGDVFERLRSEWMQDREALRQIIADRNKAWEDRT